MNNRGRAVFQPVARAGAGPERQVAFLRHATEGEVRPEREGHGLLGVFQER